VGAKATVLVLGGGPDRERPVSLNSAAQVAEALRQAGHQTIERDILPGDLSALDEPFDVVFPVLHGPWGEGGPLQRILERRSLAFVGCGSAAASIAIDKVATKQALAALDIALPRHQVVTDHEVLSVRPPAVVKPIDDGSSVDVCICRSVDEIHAAIDKHRGDRPALMVEQFIAGREMTVGILDGRALPGIEIVPRVGFYDYEAKYERDDTQYRFDIKLPPEAIRRMQRMAEAVFAELGCRDLGRVDFIVDDEHRPWFLEVNTLPGFTTHSLLPMAARRTGLEMPALCDKLIRLAHDRAVGR